MSTIIWHPGCYKEHPPSNIHHAEAINCKGVYPIFSKLAFTYTKTCCVILVHFWWHFWICDLTTKCNVLTSLRGYCTPNLKLACFVSYLKIINTFFEKWCIHLKSKLSMELKKWHWNFSGPRSFKLWIKIVKNNVLINISWSVWPTLL